MTTDDLIKVKRISKAGIDARMLFQRCVLWCGMVWYGMVLWYHTVLWVVKYEACTRSEGRTAHNSQEGSNNSRKQQQQHLLQHQAFNMFCKIKDGANDCGSGFGSKTVFSDASFANAAPFDL